MSEQNIVESIEKEVNIDVSEEKSELTIEETVESVAIDETPMVKVGVSSAFASLGNPNDMSVHGNLSGLEEDDQHPIKAIRGLRSELNSLWAPRTVSSDKFGVANYYSWQNEARDEFGYFVSLIHGTSMIKICDGKDIFGVTVDEAGFVGGQGDTPRDNSYALVVTTGLVGVRCESDVVEGDYVISNVRGVAEKTTSGCGYKVIAKETKHGVDYVTIALGVQACTTDSLGKDLKQLDDRITLAEENIVSAINISNQAYNKSTEASESSSVSEDAVKKALESILEAEKNIEDFEKILTSTESTAAQAKAIAEGAVTSAATFKDEAINRANDAWAKADNAETEAYSLCAKIDKYSVGEYSQAYGLTFEQAQGILEPGIIYAPTRHVGTEYHTETYKRTEVDYERTFTPEYLYQWGYIQDIEGYGWITIDKNFNVVSYDSKVETNTAHKSVYFSFKEPRVAVGADFGYWYTDGDVVEGTTGTYEPYTLYKWEYDHWVAVATLQGNISNRMVSEVYQTTNEIMMTVMNPRGGIAGFNAKLTDTEATVEDMAAWTKGFDESGNPLYNLATIDRSANKDGSSLALVVADVDGNKVINGASIVLSQDADGSYVAIDANHIALNGETTFTVEENGTTKINGSHIATGTLSADQITTGTLGADVAYVGTLDASQITTGMIQSKNYSYDSGNYSVSGTEIDLDTGYIRSKNFSIDENGNAYFNGTLGANAINAISISADKITAGTLDATNIKVTNLDASGIVAGTLDASKITTGTLDASQVTVTNLDASKITTGTLSADRISVTDLSAIGATIGGFDIGKNSMYNQKTSYNDIYTNGVYLGTDGVGCGSFNVSNTGLMYVKEGTFTMIKTNKTNTYTEISDGIVSVYDNVEMFRLNNASHAVAPSEWKWSDVGRDIIAGTPPGGIFSAGGFSTGHPDNGYAYPGLTVDFTIQEKTLNQSATVIHVVGGLITQIENVAAATYASIPDRWTRTNYG